MLRKEGAGKKVGVSVRVRQDEIEKFSLKSADERSWETKSSAIKPSPKGFNESWTVKAEKSILMVPGANINEKCEVKPIAPSELKSGTKTGHKCCGHRKKGKDDVEKVCCGGFPCRARRKRTLDEFIDEGVVKARTDREKALRLLNKKLAAEYEMPLNLVENLREVFNKLDTDKDGTVSGKEIMDMLKTVGATFTRQEYDDIIRSFLGSITGEINFEEMLHMIRRRKSNEIEYQQDLELAFKMFDLDGDGLICIDDLKQVMKSLGNELTDDQILTIYQYLDIDNNGLIDLHEFECILYPEINTDAVLKKPPKKLQLQLPTSTLKSQFSHPSKMTSKGSSPTASNKPAARVSDIIRHGVQTAAKQQTSGFYNRYYNEESAAGTARTMTATEMRRRAEERNANYLGLSGNAGQKKKKST